MQQYTQKLEKRFLSFPLECYFYANFAFGDKCPEIAEKISDQVGEKVFDVGQKALKVLGCKKPSELKPLTVRRLKQFHDGRKLKKENSAF